MPHPGCPTCQQILERVELLTKRLDDLEIKLEPKPTAPVRTEDFDLFWKLYPRKVGRLDAVRAFSRLTVRDRQLALEAVARYAKIWSGASPERQQFIKYPATWLRSRSWEDPEEEWRKVACPRAWAATTAPLPGKNTHAPTKREITENSPAWVRRVYDALGSKTRPVIPEALFSRYLDYLDGQDVEPPDDWVLALTRAYEEATRG